MMRVRRAKSVAALAAVADLEARCFPDDERYSLEGSTWWLAELDGVPVGFGGAKRWELDGHVYLARAGVLPKARGRGLQKRLIRARTAWAKKAGARGVYTYTIANPASANSLISCGFRAFEPLYRWGGNAAAYWLKSFKSAG